jgi:hypothetical protein
MDVIFAIKDWHSVVSEYVTCGFAKNTDHLLHLRLIDKTFLAKTPYQALIQPACADSIHAGTSGLSPTRPSIRLATLLLHRGFAMVVLQVLSEASQKLLK